MDDHEPRDEVVLAPRRMDQGLRTTVSIAVISFLVAAGKIAVWANRWYVAERFFDSHLDGSAKTDLDGYATQLLRSGNQALLQGLVMLATGLVLVGLATALRRRRDTHR